jgi:hypothetical protein
METTAPGSTAPIGSVTVPLTIPELDWAKSVETDANKQRIKTKTLTARRNDECIYNPLEFLT